MVAPPPPAAGEWDRQGNPRHPTEAVDAVQWSPSSDALIHPGLASHQAWLAARAARYAAAPADGMPPNNARTWPNSVLPGQPGNA
jgi:hypothetical protein